jgi:hypothetical protein
MQEITEQTAQALQLQLMQQHLMQLAGGSLDPNNPLASLPSTFHTYPYQFMPNLGMEGYDNLFSGAHLC